MLIPSSVVLSQTAETLEANYAKRRCDTASWFGHFVLISYGKSFNITHTVKCHVWGTTSGWNVILNDNLLNQPIEVISCVCPQTSSGVPTINQKEVVTDTGSDHATKTKPAYNLTVSLVIYATQHWKMITKAHWWRDSNHKYFWLSV